MATQMMGILEKIASKDKDYRYMATSDLLNELQKDTFRADSELERKLCSVVLTQLDDASGDISGLAVKCLGLLVRKVGEPRAEEMVKALCDKVITPSPKKEKEQQRDIAGIGLKTIIQAVTGGTLAATTTTLVTAKMLAGASNKESYEVVGDSLEILSELMSKFGGLVAAEHAKLVEALLPHLDNTRAMVRKRALQCLAALSVYLNDDLLSTLVAALVDKLKGQKGKADITRTYMQAVAQVSRSVGYRFGRFLAETVPLVTRCCDSAGEEDSELREHCLQALEGFVVRCPHDTRAYLDPLLTCALKYLKYDPNYADEDDMEEDGSEGEGDEEDEDNGSDDEQYSDDEDVSWKVRRAAAKLLTALINAYPDALPEVYRRAMPELVSRFREREEGVKLDVFHAHSALVAAVGAVGARFGKDDPASPLPLLAADVSSTLKAAARQLKEKSLKTKVGVFGVLKEVAAVLPGVVGEQAQLLVPGVLAALADKSASASALKIEALTFKRALLAHNSPERFQPQAKVLAPPVFAAAGERYYKVAAEALRVCEQLVSVLRPPSAAAGGPLPGDLSTLVKPLFNAVHARLCAQDQDQEVKEAAILAMAATVAQLGDVLGSEVPAVLKLLLERLRNEVTRLPAVRAFTVIATSPLPPSQLGGLGEVVGGVLGELSGFLRKANRALRVASLQALEALAARCGPAFAPELAAGYAEEAAALISDADLPLAGLALKFLATLVAQQPGLGAAVADKALPPALALVRSPLLQGGTLGALQSFLTRLAASGAQQASYDALLSGLLSAGQSKECGKQAQGSVAQCVAVLTSAAGAAKVSATVSQLVSSASGRDAVVQRLSLLCLGEIGRRTDLSGLAQVESSISASLGSDSEETKGAASIALGGITCGNLAKFMPSLLSQIKAQQGNAKQQYLLLQALNEVISTIASAGTTKIDLAEGERQQVLSLLLGACEGEEECRAVAAECLGRLALLHPQQVLDQLQARLASTSANERSVVVSALKYCVVDRPHPVDAVLATKARTFLGLLGDEDRHVRKAAVVATSALAHQKPQLVTPLLPELLPLLYAQTAIREDLIRTVDLGPFKHKIDDGLELRKAAYECLDILLEACRGGVEPTAFVAHLQSGLGDHQDVKLPCHLMLTKLAASEPAAVLASLDKLVGPLDATLAAKLKSDAVKQEIDRHEELVRSCLRAVDALAHMPGVDTCASFQNFMRTRVLVAPLKDKYLAIERERAEAAEGADLS